MLQKNKEDRFVRIALGLALALLIAAAAVFFIRRAAHRQRQALLDRAETVWTREVEGEKDCYLKLTLQDGEMEYRFVSLVFPSLCETLFTYGYTALNESTLRVIYPDGAALDVTVTFSEDGNEMTFTPAVTVAEDTETWAKDSAAAPS